eukprot:TRINITY_DN3915_c0_g1_i10.p2 TRINITY_DN3915_c0_g1~~TRINITY_DN3915_c0_g1_i10.p2  ORF type:complete len:150 (+),score=1.20 TRINITY_DN3915_c0_g1_i10:140-589(+)
MNCVLFYESLLTMLFVPVDHVVQGDYRNKSFVYYNQDCHNIIFNINVAYLCFGVMFGIFSQVNNNLMLLMLDLQLTINFFGTEINEVQKYLVKNTKQIDLMFGMSKHIKKSAELDLRILIYKSNQICDSITVISKQQLGNKKVSDFCKI